MPGVGLDPTIPAFKRAKTVHALDRAATVIRISNQTTRRYIAEDGTGHNVPPPREPLVTLIFH
jgi:hypothetical protein